MRRDGNDAIKADEKKGEFGEDDRKKHEADVQKMTDDRIAEIDKIAEAKEKEILTQ